MSTPHRVVVIGAGFGGLFATKHPKSAPVEVTVIDRTTHHLFQPLLYQVATGILSEGEIAPPIRDVLRHQHNARVVIGEVSAIDLDARTVTSRTLGRELVTDYDSLIVAAGSAQSYFGHDEFNKHAPGLKTIDDALEVRARVFGAFEMAEIEPRPAFELRSRLARGALTMTLKLAQHREASQTWLDGLSDNFSVSSVAPSARPVGVRGRPPRRRLARRPAPPRSMCPWARSRPR
jgi:NADH dehydrogenase FAD-containing subunit